MPTKTDASTTSSSAVLTLSGPRDLGDLGPFLKARRLAAGFRSAREAAPHLGVTTRLLVEVERGERTRRGITLGKLLTVLQQLGYQVELRPRRSPVAGAGEVTLPPLTVHGTGSVAAPAVRKTKQGKESTRPRSPSIKVARGRGPG